MDKEEVTRRVMDFFSPIIHDIEWDEKRNAWKVNVSLYRLECGCVWVGGGGDIFFEDDFIDMSDDDTLDMDLEL